jgi:NTP pyrophosphatase (non-canonical NTP hydrolase)
MTKDRTRLCETCIEDPGCQYTIGPDMNCHDYSPTFAARVVIELAEARGNHGPYQNTHHGYAILLEEVDEFWDWVKQRRKDRLGDHGLSELVQIAAVAQRIAEDCGLVHRKTEDAE